MLGKEHFANKFVDLFPEYVADLKEHLSDYNEILAHVFFGDLIDIPLFELLLTNKNVKQIEKYIDFIEDMYKNGDGDVKNVVEVTILEYLGDDETVLKNALGYFSEDIIKASQAVEATIWRRRIKYHYGKNRKLFVSFEPW
ncbi:MAG: hypothetical protein AAGU76_06465 [Sedimentibacter sp.]|uniref:DUF7674 family protein n=1 Tax=Sedimentibacter sp. TaxID=1960295 RepID=UPI0031593415